MTVSRKEKHGHVMGFSRRICAELDKNTITTDERI